MADKSVFRSLCEVFPQVDLRILKAVAIEHSRDVDAAVEFILSEVLPSLNLPSEESYHQPDRQEEHQSKVVLDKPNVSQGYQEVEDLNTALPPAPKSAVLPPAPESEDLNTALPPAPKSAVLPPAPESVALPQASESVALPQASESAATAGSVDHASLGHFKSPCMSEHTGEGSLVCSITEQLSLMSSNELTGNFKASSENFTEYKMDAISDHENLSSNSKSSSAKTYVDDDFPSGVYGGNSRNQLIVEPEDAYFSEQNEHTSKSCLGPEEIGSLASFGDDETVPAMHASDQNASTATDMPDLLDQNSNMSRDLNDREASGPNSALPSDFPYLPLYGLDNLTDSTAIGGEPLKDVNNMATTLENELSTSFTETVCDLVTLESAMVPAQSVSDMAAFENALSSLEPLLPSTITTRSGYAVSVDFLEELINDSKNNKKALVSAVETARTMLKKVELTEERAILAKKEASMAGENTITKVEELKQMLKHAKEANDMHAGEVYGEKAILAAEARELQSRILNLSNEKNQYLPVIEEIHQTLETRLDAAERDILAAEQEKLEKTDLAQKALDEQNILMDKMAEESKKLQQAAEENSKLRDFLMDRSCMVDVLQCEIAVVCEEVMSLKDRVDGRVAQSVAASSSSVSVEQLVGAAKESLKIQLDSGKEENFHGDKQKTFSDEDWEFFEDEA